MGNLCTKKDQANNKRQSVTIKTKFSAAVTSFRKSLRIKIKKSPDALLADEEGNNELSENEAKAESDVGKDAEINKKEPNQSDSEANENDSCGQADIHIHTQIRSTSPEITAVFIEGKYNEKFEQEKNENTLNDPVESVSKSEECEDSIVPNLIKENKSEVPQENMDPNINKEDKSEVSQESMDSNVDEENKSEVSKEEIIENVDRENKPVVIQEVTDSNVNKKASEVSQLEKENGTEISEEDKENKSEICQEHNDLNLDKENKSIDSQNDIDNESVETNNSEESQIERNPNSVEIDIENKDVNNADCNSKEVVNDIIESHHSEEVSSETVESNEYKNIKIIENRKDVKVVKKEDNDSSDDLQLA